MHSLHWTREAPDKKRRDMNRLHTGIEVDSVFLHGEDEKDPC
jgi:hypothetical protein